MQQLIIRRWLPVDENFQAVLDDFPSQPAFIEWVEGQALNEPLTIVDLCLGLDRAQAHISFQEYDFNLCFDATCEAIWLEPVCNADQTGIDSILAMLSG